MKRALIGFVLLASLTLAGPVFGQDDEMRETTYDFADDTVVGELVRPDGELIEGQVHGRGSSLITIRPDFIDKMIESVEDL